MNDRFCLAIVAVKMYQLQPGTKKEKEKARCIKHLLKGWPHQVNGKENG